MKKIIALVLALAMIAALGLAFADPTDVTITVPSTDSHTYKVFQIFTGTLDETGTILSDVHWGKHGTGTEGELVSKSTLEAVEAISGTDAEKAAALSAYANIAGGTNLEVSKDAPLTVKTGYYLIKDKSIAEGDTETLYIVQVVGPTAIARKASNTPTPEKTVDETNDSDSTQNAANQEVADYDIGDDVPFHVAANLPTSGMAYYSKYKLVLEDTLESGKFDSISALTKAGPIENTDDYTVTVEEVTRSEAGFKVIVTYTAKEGKTLESLEGQTITIDYTAKLGANARIGGEGNSNTFVVKYSNNPNDDQSGEPDESTPEEKVTVFTYKIVVGKVDENEDALEGAGFTLYKVSKTDALAGVPAGNDGDAKSKNAYWATKALATKGTWTPSVDGAEFTFTGLDAGYYVLCETTTPDGYNTIDPQAFVVTATYKDGSNGKEIESLAATKLVGTDTIVFEAVKDEGKFTGELDTTIQNNKGVELPHTGGIGTTIFYILGGLLVVGAAVILVARRKAQD